LRALQALLVWQVRQQVSQPSLLQASLLEAFSQLAF
jgi:hypothetical protein